MMKKVLFLLMAYLPLFAWADDIAYATFENGTLTFKYGSFTPDGETSWDVSDTGTQQFYNQELSWGGQLVHVVFDPSFIQARPKSCFAWFDACKNLEDIVGLEYLNTSEVTTMSCMFEACPKLKSLNLTHFDTSNVTDMGNMFAGTVGLTILDLSSFNTANVTNMNCMFAGSNMPAYGGPNRLRTILVGDGWDISLVTSSSSQGMFDYCPYLRGGFGTKGQNYSGTDMTYAVVDGPESPGYLTKKGEARAYAVFSEGTLTFKHDATIPEGNNWWNVGNTGTEYNTGNPEWGGYSIEENQFPDLTPQITKVVFDSSFAEARPLSCFAWFDRCTNLEVIEGLEYLNTSKVMTMAWMFEACPKLESLDLTHFNTSNVTDMGNMFAGAVGLTILDLSSFNTANVTNMTYMFAGSVNTPNNLKKIYVDDGWTVANVTTSDKMFDYCTNLVGGRGTVYNSEHNDKTYACIDAVDSPGYLSRKNDLPDGTIHVAVAGTLSTLISDDEKYTIEELTLTGDLNGTDLRLVREMTGNDYLGQPTSGKLKKLDLSGVNIVAGGEKYLDTDRITSSTGTYTQNVGENSFHYATEDNVLGTSLFAGCDQLEEVILPNSVTSIGNYVFWYCLNLSSLRIPENVSSIGWQIVYGPNNITKIEVDLANNKYDSRDNCNAIIETQSNTLFFGCMNTVIPNSVTSIGIYAFSGCSGLTSVDFPNSVTSIGGSAFEGCSGLTSITIPNSVISIGNYAFYFCRSLTSVTIPNSVTSIGVGAFRDCSGLTSIKVEDGNTTYDSRDNCNAIIETSTNTLITGCNNSTIPDGVTTIGEEAFLGCTGITSVSFPSSVTTIGNDAFHDCLGITSLTIPSSVTTIGNSAFNRCENLTSLTLSEGLVSIGNYAFPHCRSLSSVTIPNSVTEIGRQSFEECESITTVTIGSGVKTIGMHAFASMPQLTDVYIYAENVPQAYDEMFDEYAFPNPSAVTLHVPAGSVDAYKAEKPWKNFKQIVAIDEETTEYDEIQLISTGKGTWCSAFDLDFTSVEGLKAYIASGYDNKTNTIWLTRVYSVPAGEGLVLKGEPNGHYQVPHADSESCYASFLVGNYGEAYQIGPTTDDYKNFVMKGGQFVGIEAGATATIAKNRAYLQIPLRVFTGTRSVNIGYEDDGTTEINTIDNGKLNIEDNAYYNLQGQRVDNPTKGFYIKNGKKVIVR